MLLPPGVQVFERGWLSANGILLVDEESSVLVDSGYWTHADQTVALVQQALGQRPLDLVLNTHLHSDHCGGNMALQRAFQRCRVQVPPGLAQAVREWDTVKLTYAPTGQHCPQFRLDGVIHPGERIRLAGRDWEAHAAPGHDQHSIILFEPRSGVLISADALWRNGFGVVFQELEGERAFDEVAQTISLIESLGPSLVIPGHGAMFTEVGEAIDNARRRLDAYVAQPAKHAAHGAKVLLKFKLLESQIIGKAEMMQWVLSTSYFGLVHARYFGDKALTEWLTGLVNDLARSNALVDRGDAIVNI